MNGKCGEITVFLSLILLCVAGMICVMLESARMAGARCYLQIAANSSIDSLFSEYHRQLWQNYHLLGLEYRTQEDIRSRYTEFLKVYLETENWYPMTDASITIEAMQSLTDGGGIWLEKEILSYMKYGIWNNLDIVPEEGERLLAGMKESGAMRELLSSYEAESREIWKLEQDLDKVYGCLSKQREFYERAAVMLEENNKSGFFQMASALSDEIKKMPDLVKAYEKQADKLKARLAKVELKLAEKGANLTDERRRVMETGLKPYGFYVEEDRRRRKEIRDIALAGEHNRTVVDEVIDRVHNIENYLLLLKEGDEDNSGAMWASAMSVWNHVNINSLNQMGIKDEEKKKWLEQIGNMVKSNLLGLVVLPDREVSTIMLDLTDAPSKERRRAGDTDRKDIVKRVLVNEYCAMHFSNFRWEERNKGVDGLLKPQYEMEYLLVGGGNDRENLAGALKKLLMVREGMNLIHIMSDSQKREEARALALVITGTLEVTSLVEIMTFFIISMWALGESVADIRGLLDGNKIPLLKMESDWTLDLKQLLDMGKEKGGFVYRGSEWGLNYEGYLKLLLLLEKSERKYYRMMDVMQMNLRMEQSGFLMRNCGYRLDMKVETGGKHVFFTLPFAERLTGSRGHSYQVAVRTQKAY